MRFPDPACGAATLERDAAVFQRRILGFVVTPQHVPFP